MTTPSIKEAEAVLREALQCQAPGEAPDWLATIDSDEVELLRLRAGGAPWKAICWRFGISRATAHRRWTAALRRIAKLNSEAW